MLLPDKIKAARRVAGRFQVVPKSTGSLCEGYFSGVQALAALLYFKLHFVVFADFVNEAGYVYEDVFARLICLDEAKPFGFIEKFNGSCLHNAKKWWGDKASSSETK